MSTCAAARKAQLDHLLDTILEAQSNNDHVVHLIANAQGVTTAADVANISETDLQKMDLKDSHGTDVHIPGAIANKILNLSDFFIHYVDKQTHDWTTHNEFDLETFMLTGTSRLTPTTAVPNPPAPAIDFAMIESIAAAISGATTTAITNAPKLVNCLETFLKNKGTSEAYKPLREAKYWNQWHQALIAIATSQGLEDVLDPTFALGTMATSADLELWNAKHKHAYAILSSCLLESGSQQIV